MLIPMADVPRWYAERKPASTIAVRHGTETLTWDQLERAANRRARAFAAKGVKPGDFVTYYAKAADNDGVDGAQTTTSDIYFVQIRPFKKDYKPAQSMAGGGGGGGGGDQVNQLSQQQREIVAATFNIVRDKAKMPADKFREQAVFLTLAQAKLRQQVEELSGKMNSRLDAVDPAFKQIAEALPKSAAEMKTAEGNLKGQQAKEALAPEQRALKLLETIAV